MQGICRLTIRNCTFDDSGKYSCKIDKQTDETSTEVKIVGEFCTFSFV